MTRSDAWGCSGWSAFCDLILALYPVVFFWKVQLNFRVKVGLCILMGLGVMYGQPHRPGEFEAGWFSLMDLSTVRLFARLSKRPIFVCYRKQLMLLVRGLDCSESFTMVLTT